MPISKLQGVPVLVRWALKAKAISTASQLLEVAGGFEQREALAVAIQAPPELLTAIVRRADLARVKGVGVRFGQLLEELGVYDVVSLAQQDPISLHDRLRRHNEQTGLCRRSPTPLETSDWVKQAGTLPVAVHYRHRDLKPIATKGRLQAD